MATEMCSWCGSTKTSGTECGCGNGVGLEDVPSTGSDHDIAKALIDELEAHKARADAAELETIVTTAALEVSSRERDELRIKLAKMRKSLGDRFTIERELAAFLAVVEGERDTWKTSSGAFEEDCERLTQERDAAAQEVTDSESECRRWLSDFEDARDREKARADAAELERDSLVSALGITDTCSWHTLQKVADERDALRTRCEALAAALGHMGGAVRLEDVMEMLLYKGAFRKDGQRREPMCTFGFRLLEGIHASRKIIVALASPTETPEGGGG